MASAVIKAVHQNTIAKTHAAYREKSRRYSRWVEKEARKMEARLEKKRKQMERNKQKMDLGRNTYYAEVETLQARIDKTEAERLAEELRLNDKLEEIEREIAANNPETIHRADRSRAPSPEICPAELVLSPTADISEKDSVRPRAPCVAEARLETVQFRINPPPRKIIWKIKTNSAFCSGNPPSNLTPAKKKSPDASKRYIWEEYDHSEVFEEVDDPRDEDYEPSIDE
ncbi:hypothetical protein BKA65DRAFT_552720 [Rhexocercosporidium sp. MPI-PUGE-AT-0058]|nr:hypothetical protein BKA65DRAFT_552720 [Rhexocercosporidium sp. MPI-PUGE-AT-0058]